MVRHILFDLDCTLYSVSYGLEENVMRRLWQYVALYLGTSAGEARTERNKFIEQYATTLEWLIAEKGFTDIDGYFEYLYPENEVDSLPPDPELRRYLEGLPYPCSILTNSPSIHAERVIKKLGLEGIFCRVFDIKSNKLKGKPHSSAYRGALDALGLKPEEALFIDDVPRYVEGYLALGGRGILFDEMNTYPGYLHERVNKLRELARFLN